MLLIDTQLSANEVLRAFHHDEPYLLLGAAFTTVSVITLAFCAVRRRFDALLVWLAIFAHLYGERLWMDSRILHMTIPPSEFFDRLSAAVDYLVPIPAFLFFHAGGFLGRRGKSITVIMVTLFSGLVVATAIMGDRRLFHQVNNFVVIAAISTMIVLLLARRGDREFAVVRVGIVTFGLLALADNVIGRYKLEPYGFAVLLGCLGYVAARKTFQRDEALKEIQGELDLARRIQLSLLPAAFPKSAAFRVAARYVPMSSVAGDIYEFLAADGNHAGLLIADVSGHGVPAALIASMVKMAAMSQRELAAHPGAVLTGMNRALIGNTQGQYVTAAYAHLNAERGELLYAAAGHPPMLLLRGGEVIEVSENGLVLGAVDAIEYTERTMTLIPGDRIVLYTDGMVEARNASGELFSERALMSAVRKSADMRPDLAVIDIVQKVQAWGQSQEDDLTILLCDYQGQVAG